MAFLPGTSSQKASEIADLIRVSFTSRDWRRNGFDFSVTISCGIADKLADDDFEGAIQRADVALYAAKAAGRNNVSIAQQSSSCDGEPLRAALTAIG